MLMLPPMLLFTSRLLLLPVSDGASTNAFLLMIFFCRSETSSGRGEARWS